LQRDAPLPDGTLEKSQMSAIPFEQLLALAAGELDDETAAAVQRQIDQSPEALAALKRVRIAVGAMRTDDSVAPPADVVAKARLMFGKLHERQRRSWIDGLRKVVARLVYDSRLQPALAGYRSAQQTVQLSYSAESVTVDLQLEQPVEGVDAGRNLMGQISQSTPGPRLCVRLFASDSATVVQECPADDHGMFSLTVAAGRYDMAICADQWVVVIPDLQVD
jgi:hypothetical protein